MWTLVCSHSDLAETGHVRRFKCVSLSNRSIFYLELDISLGNIQCKPCKRRNYLMQVRKLWENNFSISRNYTETQTIASVKSHDLLFLSLSWWKYNRNFWYQMFFSYRKKELLSREDLMLPWKPLYDLVESVIYSACEPHGLQLFPT